MKTKEIIGYKLKDEKYRKAAKEITGMETFFDENETLVEDYCFDNYSHASDKIKEFGVLREWFIPVYEYGKPEAGQFWFHSTGQLELILEVKRDTLKTQPIHTCISTGRFACHGVCTMDREATEKEIYDALTKEVLKKIQKLYLF